MWGDLSLIFLIRISLVTGKDWRQEEKGTTENEMVGWHHRLNGHKFGCTPGVGDGQGGLECCGSWDRRVGHDWATELNWTEHLFMCLLAIFMSSLENVYLGLLPIFFIRLFVLFILNYRSCLYILEINKHLNIKIRAWGAVVEEEGENSLLKKEKKQCDFKTW